MKSRPMEILVSPGLRALCPDFCGAALLSPAVNTPACPALWQEIDALSQELRTRFTPESLKQWPPVESTRRAYRLLGKDPSRYRPSGEALIRRVLTGRPLYRIHTLADLVNLASMAHGYSIGGFDADKIRGPRLTLGIGRAGEPYEGIGRGALNIENLPVYRDEEGGIGTPTSDHERTKLSLDTRNILILVNGYDGNRDAVLQTARYALSLLRRHASSPGGTISLY